MSSDIVIRAQLLCKSYHVYKRPEDRLKQALFGAHRKFYSEIYAVKDVSFDIRRGETIGVVGRNGSGKSTLLQMICGTLTPTSGEVHSAGRIAPLLELGAGFNPEFTGRENVHFNAAILGMSEDEIKSRYDMIAAFASIGEHIDHPVKTYSSGMFARLAFAVAIHVEPEILVVDEALSVGDEAFQKRCFSRLQELRDNGVTILFVSHSAGTIIDICDRAILLDQGEMLVEGSAREVVALYQKLAYSGPAEQPVVRNDIKTLGVNALQRKLAVGAGATGAANDVSAANVRERFDPSLDDHKGLHYERRGAVIKDCRITTLDGKQVNVLSPNREYLYRYEVEFLSDAYRVSFGMMFKSLSGAELGGLGAHDVWKGIELCEAGAKYLVSYRFRNVFLPGTYFVNAGCTGWIDGEEAFLDRIVDATAFRVEETGTLQRVAGIFNLTAIASCSVAEAGADRGADASASQAISQRQ